MENKMAAFTLLTSFLKFKFAISTRQNHTLKIMTITSYDVKIEN